MQTVKLTGPKELALMLNPRGKLVLAGINPHTQSVLTILAAAREITRQSVMVYLSEEFDAALDYIAQNRIDVEKLVTSTTNLTGIPTAFERLASGESEEIKILMVGEKIKD